MMAVIQPGKINGTLTVPASKSFMQRALAAALLRKGETVIHNPGISHDDLAALQIIQHLGATVHQQSDQIIVRSNGISPISSTVHCGESGLSVRMFLPIIAVSDQLTTISGEGSLLSRPMDVYDAILPQLQVDIQSNGGRLPVQVKGPLVPADIQVDGSLSSQFITGLLMAYSAAGASDKTIHVLGLKSRPYIDLTLQVMQDFGLKVPRHQQYEYFYFDVENASATDATLHYRVESDWSSASFLIVAAAISGTVTLKGLNVHSAQADKKMLEVLTLAGVHFLWNDDALTVTNANRIQPFEFDATDCPDLFPPLAVLAAFALGTSVIKGVTRLAHKESNRGVTLQQELGKLGVSIELSGDDMIVHGTEYIQSATVHSRHDHRIAMACAVAALKANGCCTIEEAEVVNKSYPDFYKHLQQLSVDVSLSA